MSKTTIAEDSNWLGKVWELVEWIARAVFKFLFRMIGKELKEETFQSLMQFVKFGLVGVSNTLLSFGLFWLSSHLFDQAHAFHDNQTYIAWASNAIAFILSVLWSFYWNNKMVFTLEEGQKRHMGKALLKTYIAYSVSGIFLNSFLLWFWVDLIGISKLLAQFIDLFIDVPVNFIINKFWAFKAEE